jgi:hypothetical protein
MLEAGRGFDSRLGNWTFLIYLILPIIVSNREKYQKMFLGVERGRCVKLTTLPPSVSRLFRQWWMDHISQPYGSPQPLTGIVLLLLSRYEVGGGRDPEKCNISYKVIHSSGTHNNILLFEI